MYYLLAWSLWLYVARILNPLLTAQGLKTLAYCCSVQLSRCPRILSYSRAQSSLLHNRRENPIPSLEQEIKSDCQQLLSKFPQSKFWHHYWLPSKSCNLHHCCAFNFPLMIITELSILNYIIANCPCATLVHVDDSQRTSQVIWVAQINDNYRCLCGSTYYSFFS